MHGRPRCSSPACMLTQNPHQNQRMRTGVAAVGPLLRRCGAVRADMAACCGLLQAHLMCEVLERAWGAFVCRAHAAPDLDSLISAPLFCALLWAHFGTACPARRWLRSAACCTFAVDSVAGKVSAGAVRSKSGISGIFGYLEALAVSKACDWM